MSNFSTHFILQFLMSKCMNVLKLISSTNACMLVIMPPHHLSSTWHALTNQELPHVSASLVHVNTSSYCMDATCHPASGATWHPHFAKFACFINTTECDNFLIRSSFEVKRMSLELYQRALWSDVSFAKIEGLKKIPSWILLDQAFLVCSPYKASEILVLLPTQGQG